MTTKQVDTLVRQTTAFRTWSAMVECLKTGYVPTIREKTAGQKKLAQLVRENGYRTFSGRGRE